MGVQAARIVFPEPDRAEIAAEISGILTTGALSLGPYTEKFERAFATAHENAFRPVRDSRAEVTGTARGRRRGRGSPVMPLRAVAVSSGTSALEIVLRSIGVAGRDVILPANAFYGTAAAVISAGARPVFADIDKDTFALSQRTLAGALTSNTAAVVLVHIAGMITPAVDDLRRLCQINRVKLVEDASDAHGSRFEGRSAGSFGAAAAFSFYPTKLVTSGEGGMILTRSADLEREARIYRDQGRASFVINQHVRPGYAWRMDELSAVTGLVHLRRLGEFIARRRAVAAHYEAGLASTGFLRPLPEPPGCMTNVSKFIALLPPGIDRTWFKEMLADRHDVHLAAEACDLPLHLQPVLAEYASGQSLPTAEDICRRHVCLPVHSDMREDEADQVLEAVAKVSADAPARHGESACAPR
ncbi:MAG: DegT/DnrJ/EryC1/StrS family aminotransferase [Streptosporangiaceae bacterium]